MHLKLSLNRFFIGKSGFCTLLNLTENNLMERIELYPVLTAMLHPELVVARTGVDSILAFLVRTSDIHAAAALSAFDQSREYAVVSPCVGSFPAFDLARDKLECFTVNDRLVHVLDGDPVLRLFRSYPADLEFVLGFL